MRFSIASARAWIVLAALLAAPVFAAADDVRPNIVFILADDLRWDALSSTGHTLPGYQTPSIDRLAHEGATFTHAFVTTPLCFPSRASILTGRYVHSHGVRVEADRAKGHDLITFPLLLHRAGYETAFFGKWHLEHEDVPPPGIDHWVSFRGQGQYVDPELFIDHRTEKRQGYLTAMLNDYAVEFLRQPHNKPFLLYLSHKAPHAPFTPAGEYRGRFNAVPVIPPPGACDTWEGKPVLKRPGIVLDPTDSDVETTHFNVRDYLSTVLSIDDGVGRILAALKETGQLDSTIIVFTSDNGYFFTEHDLGGKHGPYEEAVRVPLLVRYPKLIPPRTHIDGFALNIDLAPTFLDAAAVPVPPDMEGRSLLPLFRGDVPGWRTSFLSEFFLGGGTNRFPDWQALRTTQWKYIHYVNHDEFDELYDLAADPHELSNVIHDAGNQDELRKLRGELGSFLPTSSGGR
jgi:N-acetylglucosamine-6-sulfatase